ncbi:MAG: hypothetical protein CGU29_13230 [Candidatus Dactylopiibacterium carminicum]|uniref:Maltoporin n=1 Tax=Candidatus Dactylopiibacterium carminicum TaxID=857335 RepID=A0A272EPK3_9RHOO|nr:hypothetical protein [Candidatus Dactylopiibacterium carminicum]PAS92045.1 MAG: hypothetical protein CGU29_13230 [Candidatus Dactylopiibacterium carminicum]
MKKQILAASIAAALVSPVMAADPAVEKLEKQIIDLQKQVAEIKQAKDTPAATETGTKFRVYGFPVWMPCTTSVVATTVAMVVTGPLTSPTSR